MQVFYTFPARRRVVYTTLCGYLQSIHFASRAVLVYCFQGACTVSTVHFFCKGLRPCFSLTLVYHTVHTLSSIFSAAFTAACRDNARRIRHVKWCTLRAALRRLSNIRAATHCTFGGSVPCQRGGACAVSIWSPSAGGGLYSPCPAVRGGRRSSLWLYNITLYTPCQAQNRKNPKKFFGRPGYPIPPTRPAAAKPYYIGRASAPQPSGKARHTRRAWSMLYRIGQPDRAAEGRRQGRHGIRQGDRRNI